MLQKLCLLFALLISLRAWADSEGTVTLLGLDEKGSPVSQIVNKKEFSQRLTVITDAVNESALTAMSRQAAQATWDLRTFTVGIGASLEVGLGPIIKVKGTPRFRLVYSNLEDPITP